MALQEQTPIETTTLVDLSINAKEVANHSINFLRERFRASGQRKFVLGLSGGVDSAVSLALAVQAVGAENVIVLKMPYGDMGKRACDDADLVIETFGILPENTYTVNIKPVVDTFLVTMGDDPEDPGARIRKANAMARERMMALYHISHALNGQVLGTENKSEHLLGYCTRGGDELSDNEPILHLYKVQVWQLAEYLGVPEKIVKKMPSADLWPGQTDETELGFTYTMCDQILTCYKDRGETVEQIVQRGFDPGLVAAVINRMNDTVYKREIPYKPPVL